jgi:ATP-dependent DNA helicase RecG
MKRRAIFDEITSCPLYGNLTVESLKTNTYQAYARNKLISEAFYLTVDIEKYGSGFRRIRNEIKRYPSMELVCEEVPNGFLVTISYVSQKTSAANERINEMGGGINEGINLLLALIEKNPNQRIPFFTYRLNVLEKTALLIKYSF